MVWQYKRIRVGHRKWMSHVLFCRLYSFLCSSHLSQQPSPAPEGEGGSVTVKVHYTCTVALSVPVGTPYSALRERIAHKLGRPAERLCLRYVSPCFSPQSLHCRDKQDIHYFCRQNSHTNASSPPPPQIQAAGLPSFKGPGCAGWALLSSARVRDRQSYAVVSGTIPPPIFFNQTDPISCLSVKSKHYG